MNVVYLNKHLNFIVFWNLTRHFFLYFIKIVKRIYVVKLNLSVFQFRKAFSSGSEDENSTEECLTSRHCTGCSLHNMLDGPYSGTRIHSIQQDQLCRPPVEYRSHLGIHQQHHESFHLCREVRRIPNRNETTIRMQQKIVKKI